MYAKGRGVPLDYAEAVRWYRKAADAGDTSAQCNLGIMYDKGQGVPLDYAEAVRWFREAANAGGSTAQRNLGFMYSKGWGVTQSYAEAYLWFNLSASNASGDDQQQTANLRDEVANKLTPQQLAEAQQMAREWRPAAPVQSVPVK